MLHALVRGRTIMKRDNLIEKIEKDCPICNKTHLLEMRKGLKRAIIKGDIVEYEAVYFLCTMSNEEENEFVSAGLMDENLERARDAYRTKKEKN